MAGSEAHQEAASHDVIILDIQRMSTEDGPGLRTTVFFKGCNLNCPWCHNPESINRKPVLVWQPRKCTGCNICQRACQQKGISRGSSGLSFERSICLACGSCARECPGAAIEIKGKSMSVEKLTAELIKDKAYFGAEGGITLSGGEVLMQYDAALALAQALKIEGLHITLDTAGCYDFLLLESLLPFIDLVLYDLKIFDSEVHKKLLRADNRIILKNFRLLMERNVRVWVRTPIIEGATGTEENIEAIGRFIVEAGRGLLPEKWELCAFNNLCRDKYEGLDLEWAYKDVGLNEKTRMEKLTAIAARYVPGAVYTGSVTGT